eukprot:14729838-Alexandrium_andersonii.AAC.1
MGLAAALVRTRLGSALPARPCGGAHDGIPIAPSSPPGLPLQCLPWALSPHSCMRGLAWRCPLAVAPCSRRGALPLPLQWPPPQRA